MKPTVLHPMSSFRNRISSFGTCFALMRFMFARTNHTLSSAPEVSSHKLLHFPAFSNPSCWVAACARWHRAAPSSKIPMWLRNQRLRAAGLKWLQLQMLTITEERTGLGRTCQAQTLPGSQEEKEGESREVKRYHPTQPLSGYFGISVV